jgi:carotenoid 1,2-hydratase
MSDTHLPHPGPFRPALRSGTGTGQPDDALGLRPSVSRVGRIPLRAEPARDIGGLPETHGDNGDPGPLPRGGRGASGGGRADGDPLRPARGRGDIDGPNFNLDVPPNGYAWWYIDGIRDGGGRAISIIAFIGSVFSPWYAWSGRRSPDNHVCINVATYGPGGRFTMTDRGKSALRQTPDNFTVGPSSLSWKNGELVIDINEIGALPMVSRVRGRLTVKPQSVTGIEVPLTADGAHIWRPFAPTCEIEVDLDAPGWQWTGHGYFDANFGTRALEQDFAYWTWGRFPTGGGSTCFYDATLLDGSDFALGVKFDADGTAHTVAPPPKSRFSRSLWAVARETRADPGYAPKQVQAMLDAPFYCRSAVRTKIDGEETVGVHEALDLVRFRSPLLKPMLAVRVPRRPGWTFSD